MLIVVLSVILFSCGEDKKKQIEIPAGVLAKEKMAEVIADIHIAEAEESLTPPSDTAINKFDFQKIFEKNKISKTQYDSSLMFYTAHPELLDTVYEKVMNKLSLMQGEEAKTK